MYHGHQNIKVGIYSLAKDFIINNKLNIDLLVDFGARHGESYEHLGHLCKSDYVFVEPVPKAISVIKQSMLTLPISPRVHLIDSLLGDTCGNIDMFIFENDEDQSSNIFTNRSNIYGKAKTASVKVEQYNIFDKMFPNKKIDFTKVNIEGCEYKMIDDHFFHDKINSFVIELHNNHVHNRNWRYAIDKLQDEFDVMTYGDLQYKHCFVVGTRCD